MITQFEKYITNEDISTTTYISVFVDIWTFTTQEVPPLIDLSHIFLIKKIEFFLHQFKYLTVNNDGHSIR